MAKKYLLGCAVFFSLATGRILAQDVAVIATTAPVSGCNLSASENVVIRIFNYGPTDLSGMAIPVSYTLDGGTAVNEVANFVSFLPNSTATYTFMTLADLSAAGTHTIDASTALGGDINPTNDAFSGYLVTNTAPSVGGTVMGGTNVCISGNTGNVTLSGHTGTVQNWEYSTDGGSTWINISNTTTSQSYSNLIIPTSYRANVQNGICAATSSSATAFTIDPATVAGTVGTAATVCNGVNTGTLTLTGKTGNVQYWEFSTNGGSTWTTIANTTTSQSYLNLTTTTVYRANVKSGACTALNTNSVTITVNPVSVGGTLSAAATTVCSGANSGTLTLSGHTGAIARWEFSTNGGSTWTNIANTTTTQNYTNLTTTTQYRVRVQSAPCSVAYSATATVTVSPASTGGAVTASATECSGTNSGTLTLAGHAGAVLNWEFSTDGGTTWGPIANTTTSELYTNLTTTTSYRAIVQNGSCTASPSTAAVITVNALSVGGTLASDATVCASGNSGTINLSGNTGTVQNWESSTDNGTTWSTIVNTTSSLNYTNLTDTTLYRSTVKNGVCPSTTSSTVTVTVDPVTVGGTVSAGAAVCSGLNSGTLNLAGNTGMVQNWEYSTDGGSTWVNIVNTSTAQAYTNISTNTIFRALVKSGVCSSSYSGTVLLTVDPQAIGGTTYGTATVCEGANSGSITLVGYSAVITTWESSTDGGTTWMPIASTNAVLNYTNLLQSTSYHAITSSGVCPNDTSSVTLISVDIPSVGGLVSSSDTVCAGANAGMLTLSGNTGNVLNWEYSTDGGTSWGVLSNTSLTQNYSNLTQSTYYRASVKNGVCAADLADSVYIKVDTAVVAGSILSPAQLCISNANGTLTLSGYAGSILDWESSADNGATWSGLTNTANTYAYSGLTDTTYYRAIVTSGVCGTDTTAPVIIGVDQLTVGGAISTSDTVCASGNGATLNITGSTGLVQGWEYSINNGNSWIPISNTTLSQAYTNLTQTTLYRATLKNGVCPIAYADTAIIQVDANVMAGTISSPAQLCISNANGTLTLAGYTGSVTDWESSSDNGTTWGSLANTTNTNAYAALTDTTYYRAIVTSGVCGNDTTSNVIITVDQLTVGGAVDLSDTVCANGNAAVLNITGSTGLVQGWEYSINNGNSWIPINNTTLSQAYTNLTQTTLYRATLKSGVCPVAYADTAIIQVDPVAVAGIVSSPAHLCVSNANGTLTLSGYTGSVADWEISATNGAAWTGLGNTSNTLAYALLTDTTWYRAIVTSGVCGNDTTAPVIIGVDQLSVGGTIDLSDTVCAALNGDTLNIVGSTGLVQSWEYSINSGSSWIPLTNTTTSQIYSNLSQTTLYRATVKNGVCPAVYADTAIVQVDPVTVAGAISSPAHLCVSNANGTLTLAGYTGSIVDWESSGDNGATWTGLSNTVNTYSYASLTDTTYYRAVVVSGVCGNDTTATVIIGVDQLSVAGTLSIADTVCASANSDTLALTGYTGMITSWEFSTNNGISWIPLTTTNDSLSYVDLNASTNYHVIIKNGVCPAVYSNDVKITVDQVTNPGIITSGTTGCELNNHGTLYVSSAVGQVSDWIYSTDNGSTWQSSGVDSVAYVYNNLSDTTIFQAVVQNGVCAKDTAAPITILVYPKPNVTFTVDTVCFKDTTHFVNLTTLASGFIATFTWNYGDGHTSNTNQNYVYATADTFNVSLVAFSNFGCSDTATAVALVKRAPSAVITHASSLSFCPGDSTVLTFTLDTNSVYTWNTGDTLTSVTIDTTYTVVLTVNDTLTGCSAKDSVMTMVFQLDSISAGIDTTINIGTPYMLTGYGEGTVSWTPVELLDNPTSLNPLVTLTEATAFVLMITDANGCAQRDTVSLNVRYDYVFDIKNLITPNGDGMNDQWVIKNIESYPDNQVTVFNREGNVVFQKTGYMNDWEGTFNGKSLPDGAYFYIVKFDNSEKVLKGDINILSNK
ncbi:MAG: Ig-like protein [Bacteroidetes bacterium]|nr:Ig-like protein [Bacteroidota bacterium]